MVIFSAGISVCMYYIIGVVYVLGILCRANLGIFSREIGDFSLVRVPGILKILTRIFMYIYL